MASSSAWADWVAARGTMNTSTSALTMSWNPRPEPVSQENPLLVGSGPVECSSSRALSVVPLNIYDVNGYYRELGVTPRATRKELRVAYQAKDGQSSVRLTYIMKQLVQPQVRFAYDCVPLGEVFMDAYVRDMLNRKMKDQMSKRMAALADLGVDLDKVDEAAIQRDIYHEMGFETEDETADDDTPSEVVDEDPSIKQDESSPAKFEYAYYLWATSLKRDPTHLDLLGEWQRQLVSAFDREGISIKFAVGLHGKPHRWVMALVGYRNVFFLNPGEEPTEELAGALARQVRLDREQEQRKSIPSRTGR